MTAAKHGGPRVKLVLGHPGKAAAAAALREAGHSRAEIDLIALEGKLLVFVEVKTRSTDFFGQPESFVSKRKEKLLAAAAAAYMEQKGHEWAIRFDVVAVCQNSSGQWEVRHLPDAFFPGLE